MTCEYKEYEVKHLQLKIEFLLGYNLKIVIKWGDEPLLGG